MHNYSKPLVVPRSSSWSRKGGAAAPDLTDLQYFIESTYGVALDTLLQQCLLGRLPVASKLELVTGSASEHPHVVWTDTDPDYAFYRDPDDAELLLVCRMHTPVVVILPKTPRVAAVHEILALHYGNVDCWQSLGDLVMLVASARNGEPVWLKKFELLRSHCTPDVEMEFVDPHEILDATLGWDVEKISEEGYMQHLDCIDSSPYLTQL